MGCSKFRNRYMSEPKIHSLFSTTRKHLELGIWMLKGFSLTPQHATVWSKCLFPSRYSIDSVRHTKHPHQYTQLFSFLSVWSLNTEQVRSVIPDQSTTLCAGFVFKFLKFGFYSVAVEELTSWVTCRLTCLHTLSPVSNKIATGCHGNLKKSWKCCWNIYYS